MRILRSVGSSDTITARAGLNELNDILESPEKQAALRDYEEIYIENVCLQLRVSQFLYYFISSSISIDAHFLKFFPFHRICHKYRYQMRWPFTSLCFPAFTLSTHHVRLAKMSALNL